MIRASTIPILKLMMYYVILFMLFTRNVLVFLLYYNKRCPNMSVNEAMIIYNEYI